MKKTALIRSLSLIALVMIITFCLQDTFASSKLVSIVVQVRDGGTRRPVRGATCIVFSKGASPVILGGPVVTNPGGIARIDGLPPSTDVDVTCTLGTRTATVSVRTKAHGALYVRVVLPL